MTAGQPEQIATPSGVVRSAATVASAGVLAVLLWQGETRLALVLAALLAIAAQVTALTPSLARRASRVEGALARQGQAAGRWITRAASPADAPGRPRLLHSAWWRERAGITTATFVACSALVAPIFVRLAHDPKAQVVTNNDVYLHIQLADRMRVWPPEIPHPVFHYLYLAAEPVLGSSWAPLVPFLFAIALMAVGLVRIGGTASHGRPGLRGGMIVAFAVATIVSDTPTLLLSASGLIEPTPVMTNHMWWSPTALLLFGASLLLVPLVTELVAAAPPTAETHARVRRVGGAVLALTVLSTFSRPNLIVALIPGLALYLLRERRWNRPTLSAAIRWLVIPAMVILSWQAWLGRIVEADQTGGIAIEPFRRAAQFALFVHPWFFYISAVPTIVAAVWARKRFTREPAVFLTTQSLWVSLVPMLLLSDTGMRGDHGFYLLPPAAVWLVLWVLTVRFWIGELVAARAEGRAGARRFRLIAAGTAVWVAAGVVSQATAMGLHRFAMV